MDQLLRLRLARLVLAANPGGRSAEEPFPEPDRPVDEAVDEVLDRRANLVDDPADGVADAAQAEEAREEADREREALPEAVGDLLGDAAEVALGDVDDRVEDRVDEVGDLLGALEDERDHVDDRLHDLDQRARRVQQADQPRDAGLDHLRDDEVLDPADHEVVEVADLLLDELPEPGRPLRADLLRQPVEERLLRQPEHLQDERDDALEVEALRLLDAPAAEH